MRGLRPQPHRLQQLPQPALPQMPGRGGKGLARRARGRSLAGRLLPRRLHAAGRDRRHRLAQQGGDLRPPVPRRLRGDAHDRRRSEAPRRPHRHHRRAPHLGLGDDPSPARPHDRARRRHLARRHALGALQAGLLPARARALKAVPAALPVEARRRPCRRPPAVLRRSRRPERPQRLRCLPGAASEGRTGSSMPSRPSPDPRPCWPICRATPTASRSPTAG